MLTQLRHYGGKTNLIDFATDYLRTLFFACDGSHDKDGRIIM
ncbi:FRG domain-containing protein [Candidatus Poribacteria bacterium]|nr:FRG domain-containing protein [Candidatus Poribacteria bacterium]